MAKSKRELFATAAEVAYRKAFAVFEQEAASLGIALYPLRPNGECFEVRQPDGKTSVEVVGALKIERLPRRHAESEARRTQGTVAVLMSSKEIYFLNANTPGGSFLAASWVSLGYYDPRVAEWNTLLSLRYDFNERGAQDGHPIFHVQLGDGAPGRELARLHGVPAVKPLVCLASVRMPSANMVGPTAILKLAADHFPHASFLPVLRNMQALPFFQNWQCDCRTLDKVDSARGMIATGWYGTKLSRPDT